MIIGFYGMSHLGINYMTASAAKGFKSIAYDENKKLIDDLVSGKKIINEPNVFKNIKKYKKNIVFTNNFKNFEKCKIIFISSDVSTNSKGKSDLKPINKNIIKLKKKFSNKNLIIMSQVNPGFTEKINWNKDKLFHQVETLIFGKAYYRALKPERIIIGAKNENKKLNKDIKNYYDKFKCPIIVTNYKTSELIKISINLFLISSISTSNLLSKICKKIGAEWDDIENSLRSDKRIGKYAYLKPGLGISGGNLERDLFNIINISYKNKIENNLFQVWKKNSSSQQEWAYEIYKNYIKKLNIKKIGILGLSYKENTNSVKNSPAIRLIKKLSKINFYVFDPVVKNINLRNVFKCKNIKEVVKKSKIIFILTPWKKFKKINLNLIKRSNIVMIIDPFGVLKSFSKKLSKNNIKYFSLN